MTRPPQERIPDWTEQHPGEYLDWLNFLKVEVNYLASVNLSGYLGATESPLPWDHHDITIFSGLWSKRE